MNLVRGQRVPFYDRAGGAFALGIEINGVEKASWEFLCLLIGDNDRVVDEGEVLYDASQRSRCGTVLPKLRDGKFPEFQIDLSRAPAHLKSLVFAIVFLSPTARGRTAANQISAGTIRLKPSKSEAFEYKFAGADFGQETAIVLLEVYRKDPWRLMTVGSGFLGGMPALFNRYGVSLEVVQAIERGEVRLALAPESLHLPSGWPGGMGPKVPSGLLSAVGLVLIRDAEGNSASGTAFAVSPGGFLITCAHVVENAVEIGVVMEGKTVIRPAVVAKADPDLDVALLMLNDRNGFERWFQLGHVDCEHEIGQEVGILGYPLRGALGVNVTYSHGIVNSLRHRPGGQGQILQIDAGAAPGSSGAPVFNRSDGTVLGILSSGLDTTKGGMLINFAVDLRSVLRLGWFG